MIDNKAVLILAAASFLAACGPQAAANEHDSVDSDIAEVAIADVERAAAEAERELEKLVSAEASDEPLVSAEPSTPSAPLMPSYDVISYCRQVGDAAGGSSMIEKSCREMESEARSAIAARAIPVRMHNYCEQVGGVAGGSYSIYNSCVEMELDAASSL